MNVLLPPWRLSMTGKGDKREAILEAMLDLIVERGFQMLPCLSLRRGPARARA